MGELLRSNFINKPETRPPLTDGSLALAIHNQPRIPDNVVLFEPRPKPNQLWEEVDYLEQNYREEGLPRDWWNINDVGFSMKTQMRLLTETGDANQVERDLRGFCLEYLKQEAVFPFEYEIENGELVDRKYGNRRMIDTVDARERGGAVLESLSSAQKHLLESGDGATAIMVSPPGWTGLAMDDGSGVVYQDTMIFHIQRQGDRVVGTTFRTDFDLDMAKVLIKQLTGQELSPLAGIIDCIKAVSLMHAGDSTTAATPEGLIDMLRGIKGSRFSYKDKTWADMRQDVSRRQELYEFDKKTGEIISEFKEYASSGEHSESEIQKALAATFLRLSKYFLVDKKTEYGKDQEVVRGARRMSQVRVITYGQIVAEVQKLPGCAGGGKDATSVSSIIERSALFLEPDNYGKRTFNCPNVPLCGKLIIRREKNKLISNCPHCGADVRC